MMSSNKRLIISATLLLCFIVLAFLVYLQPINQVDVRISQFIQQFRNKHLDQFMITISAFGNIEIAVLSLMLTSSAFFYYKRKREAIFILSISLTGIITFTLKRLFNRPRPTADFVALIDNYKNNSFPSGHTLSYMVFFGFLIFLMQQLTALPRYLRISISVISYVMCIVGPISRIYLGAHWFTDILGGLLIGMLFLQQLIFYYKRA